MNSRYFSRVGYLQFPVKKGCVQENLEYVRTRSGALAGVPQSLLVLPELWAYGFDYAHAAKLAAQTPALLKQLTELAAESGIVFAGSLLEEHEHGGKPYNTLFVVGATGVIGKFRKRHLFSFWKEDRFFTPGAESGPLQTPWGLLAGLVCYDLRFPEVVNSQAFRGAELLVVSAQWPLSRIDHWKILLRARAVENQLFVVGANSCDQEGEHHFGGHSLIIAPDGRIINEAGEGDAAVVVDLDHQELISLRARFCSVAERPFPGEKRQKSFFLEEVAGRLEQIRKQGSTVAFTNGCFDILHSGHVDYLEEARRSADCLVVGLNSNRSVRQLKGPSRPVNDEVDRARVLAALECVDFIVIFDEETPLTLIKTLRPDVLVKGADWPEDRIVGAVEVKENGGRVLRIPFRHDISTTRLISKIQSNMPEDG